MRGRDDLLRGLLHIRHRFLQQRWRAESSVSKRELVDAIAAHATNTTAMKLTIRFILVVSFIVL